MKRHYYSNTISGFVADSSNEILGELSRNSAFAVDLTQKAAWLQQIENLKPSLQGHTGQLFFEYSIPRMGRRVDVVLIIENVIFVLEYKVGERAFLPSAIDQVWDYALDLKNFHETSHKPVIVPILIATEANNGLSNFNFAVDVDGLISPPVLTNSEQLSSLIDALLGFVTTDPIDCKLWSAGRYSPTPTIIEAATALYNQHSVADISRSDASAKNLRETGMAITEIIDNAKKSNEKAICFVTGVPGAGKTLVGLDVATRQMADKAESPSVFLSGNGPLVAILREALARDTVRRAKEKGERISKGEATRRVKLFIQNVHHYRDEYLSDDRAPVDHVAIFDEAQRAWNLSETSSFMKRKKNQPNFAFSEPEFLISCLNRHQDWAVIVCLVGGGQEINRGEAGIGEWVESLNRSFPDWTIHISDRLRDSEYAAGEVLSQIQHKEHVRMDDRLHLSVSMRSYRAENVSGLVKELLDVKMESAAQYYDSIRRKYPLVLTRDLRTAKEWLREKARGSERYGLLASSSAHRLKAHCIDIKSPMNPVNWFLEGKNDVRSSYFLEDVATEFHVQGLELDWACVTWDADFRFYSNGWSTHSFVGTKWQRVLSPERKQYLKNAYRVLLTRARQGMVIVVPNGDGKDDTRKSDFYDGTFEYLKAIGFEAI
ncbi:MAG: DUF2075 domain-containing protein [Blastocatellia bacterium]|nr:DUF2075 domain-containing protein [Blastocatellia bacterium]